MSRVRLALAQINPLVGMLVGNEEKTLGNGAHATELQAYVVAFPEQAVAGLPPEDPLLRPSFEVADRASRERIVARALDREGWLAVTNRYRDA